MIGEKNLSQLTYTGIHIYIEIKVIAEHYGNLISVLSGVSSLFDECYFKNSTDEAFDYPLPLGLWHYSY